MPALQLQQVEANAGDVLSRGGPLVAYDVATGDRHLRRRRRAHRRARRPAAGLVAGRRRRARRRVLSAEIDLHGEPHLVRCDRVDFPADGVAFLHTHQGPGIRCLVDGLFAVETQGTRHEIDRLGAWFEAGPDPVYAEVRGDPPAAFVRV